MPEVKTASAEVQKPSDKGASTSPLKKTALQNDTAPAEKKPQIPKLSTVENKKPVAGPKAEAAKTSEAAEKKQLLSTEKTPAAEKKTETAEKKPSAEVKPQSIEKKPEVAENKVAVDKKLPTAEKAMATEKKPEPIEKPAVTAGKPAEKKALEAELKSADSRSAAESEKKSNQMQPPKPEETVNTSGSPKSLKITQVFADRLDKPSEADLKKLPVPKEGEGYFMQLHPAYFFEFLDHPFSINREVKDYKELYDSIKENGINEPIKARPRPDGGLEVLSGHRRRDIATQLNYPIPVVIVQMDDDSARIEVVDGNLHRQDIPTSELARAAKMKMEALARKVGRRSKMDQLTEGKKRTDQVVAEDMGMSRNQVARLVRIDSLVPELKQQVDEKKLPFNTAVELSYMKPAEQDKVVNFMAKEQIVPSISQAAQLKAESRKASDLQKKEPNPNQKHEVDEKKIESIIKPKKEPELKVTLSASELRPYFPERQPSVPEAKRAIFEAMELRKKALARQAQKQQIKDTAQKPGR